MLDLSLQEITTVTLILFAIIDVPGQIPIVIAMRARNAKISPGLATIAAGAIMIAFLFVGERFLSLIGVDLPSFATAGSIIVFIIALEMILGIDIFKTDYSSSASTLVPLVFPLIAGAGTLTTLLSLRAAYKVENIVAGVVINLVIVYFTLRAVPWLERRLGPAGADVMRRAFGLILMAIAVKLFKTHGGLAG